MSNIIKLRKGLDIRLEGFAEKRITALPLAEHYALSPLDFEGIVPKLLIRVGDRIEAGDALFFAKRDERIVFTSPVSGEVAAIDRGEKRQIQRIVVRADAEQRSKAFDVPRPEALTREQTVELLLRSGLWPTLIQRPFGRIADPSARPRAIFVSGFDTAPLAPDLAFALQDEEEALRAGFRALRLLCDTVHLSLPAGSAERPVPFEGVQVHRFSGPHPAGNVGVQIHHIAPVAKGETVWTVALQDVAAIGRLFLTGRLDRSRVIAVAGSEVLHPHYYRVMAGAPVASILADNVRKQGEGERVRIISGNVLTGVRTPLDGYLSFYAGQLTLIPEGDRPELLGWALPRLDQFSVSRTYFSWLFPRRCYNLSTNLHGGVRPFVVTGLYERYLPMDIYPMYLLKAILAGDIDKMEELGIYEVLPEDLALCEFVDPSKTEMQEIVRQGIERMIKEMD